MPPRGPRGGSASELPYLLCADEVATLLRVSRKAVYCMVDRGEIPGVTKIGRRIRFHRDDLLAWLEDQRLAH